MTPAELETAAVELLQRSRIERGLSATIDDADVLDGLAALVVPPVVPTAPKRRRRVA